MVHDHGKSTAFPVPKGAGTPGVNIREYFAAAALQGILASAGWQRQRGEVIELAIKFADEMIEKMSEEH
jgi:hypothetical protein